MNNRRKNTKFYKFKGGKKTNINNNKNDIIIK